MAAIGAMAHDAACSPAGVVPVRSRGGKVGAIQSFYRLPVAAGPFPGPCPACVLAACAAAFLPFSAFWRDLSGVWQRRSWVSAKEAPPWGRLATPIEYAFFRPRARASPPDVLGDPDDEPRCRR